LQSEPLGVSLYGKRDGIKPSYKKKMRLNAHKIAMLEAIDSGSLESFIDSKASELFRISSIGLGGRQNGWTLAQHVEALRAEALELAEERESEPTAQPTAPRRAGKYVANGFYGTSRDHARGFDGIE
jgi:hypothetical protein